MLLGRVIGTVVPAMLVDELSATPLLWVQPLDRDGQPEGDPLVCAGVQCTNLTNHIHKTQNRNDLRWLKK